MTVKSEAFGTPEEFHGHVIQVSIRDIHTKGGDIDDVSGTIGGSRTRD